MRFKFALIISVGVISAATGAQARTSWHLYGAVPVSGDRTLELAYSDALAHCRLEGYQSRQSDHVFETRYDAPEWRSCLSRKGFIFQGGEPHAYPFPKVTYTHR